MRVFETLDRTHQRVLHVVRQAGGNAVWVVLVGGQTFGLKKYLVRIFVRETRYFVFNRRTITRADAFDHAGKKRRTIKARADNVVGTFIGMRNPARQLLRMLRA